MKDPEMQSERGMVMQDGGSGCVARMAVSRAVVPEWDTERRKHSSTWYKHTGLTDRIQRRGQIGFSLQENPVRTAQSSHNPEIHTPNLKYTILKPLSCMINYLEQVRIRIRITLNKVKRRNETWRPVRVLLTGRGSRGWSEWEWRAHSKEVALEFQNKGPRLPKPEVRRQIMTHRGFAFHLICLGLLGGEWKDPVSHYSSPSWFHRVE